MLGAARGLILYPTLANDRRKCQSVNRRIPVLEHDIVSQLILQQRVRRSLMTSLFHNESSDGDAIRGWTTLRKCTTAQIAASHRSLAMCANRSRAILGRDAKLASRSGANDVGHAINTSIARQVVYPERARASVLQPSRSASAQHAMPSSCSSLSNRQWLTTLNTSDYTATPPSQTGTWARGTAECARTALRHGSSRLKASTTVYRP